MNQAIQTVAIVIASRFAALLEIRCNYAALTLLEKTYPANHEMKPHMASAMFQLEMQAWEEGFEYGLNHPTKEIPILFRDVPKLASNWSAGFDNADEMRESRMMLEHQNGSIEEFEALTPEQRESEWEEFHRRCAQGDADAMYFYRVMMDKWMVGYVGD